MTPNMITIDAYNNHVDEYIKNTPQNNPTYRVPMLKWIDTALALIPKKSYILEIGSATTRDAIYIRNKGYDVQCSDAAIGFVNYLKSQGEPALLLDILKDSIEPNKCNMIFANGVMQHFNEPEFIIVCKKAYNSIKTGGLFVFSTKQGIGEKWITEKIHAKRFIHYWEPPQILKTLQRSGFKVVSLTHNTHGDLPDHRWIMIIAQKHLTAAT